MKIRLLDDSIRLRLDREEVEALGAAGRIEGRTRFPGGAALVCTLRCGADYAAQLGAAGIELTVPEERARHWAATDSEVSIVGAVALGPGALDILVEKDFECLLPRDGETQSNRFPNPKAR